MNCIDFFIKVLPANGTYIGTYKNSEGVFWNEGFDTLAELQERGPIQNKRGTTSYFALGNFENNLQTSTTGRPKWSRTATQAVSFKTLALDIDCGELKIAEGKGYANQRDGIRALGAFLRATALPQPMLISSGNGIHCYWPLTKEITKQEWVTHGKRLRTLCAQHNFIIDQSKVHDASMVLRPLGTTNFKGGGIVTLLRDAGPFVIGDLSNTTPLTLPMPPMPATPVVAAQSSITSALLDSEPDFPPSDPARIISACAQIKLATKENGRTTGQTLWFYALGTASRCIDPVGTAQEWSRGHPNYTERETLTKLNQWNIKTGPTTCATFDEKSPGICPKCSHWGVISTPNRLGEPRPATLAVDPTNVAVPQPISGPPKPFDRTVKGVTLDVGGIPMEVCPYDLFPLQIVRDPANGFDESIWFWDKPYAGYTKFSVRLSHIFAEKGSELAACLADNGVLIGNKQKQEFIGRYMKAYIQQLQKQQASSTLYDSYGWKHEFQSFVLGSTEYRREADGSVSAIEIGVSKLLKEKNLHELFHTHGKASSWRTLTKVLGATEMSAHAFMLGGAFGSPLVALTGLAGNLNVALGQTGLGKTTMLQWIASVYGSHRMVIGRFTHMAFAERLGLLGNLPMMIDEATLMPPEQVADLVYWGSEGRDKTRKTETLAKTWANGQWASSNRSFRDKMGALGGDHEALDMRILEFDVPTSSVFVGENSMGRKIQALILENYGWAGQAYITHLVGMGPERIQVRLADTLDYIATKYKFTFEGKERFWELQVVTNYLGLTIAKELDLIAFDPEASLIWILNQITIQRKLVYGGKLDTYDMIFSYLNEFNGEALSVIYNGKRAMIQEPTPRGKIRIRKEIYLDGKGDPSHGYMYFDKAFFQQWLVKAGYDLKRALHDIATDRADFMPNTTGRVYMGKDTDVKLGQVRVVGLNLSHERLRGMLDISTPVQGTDVKTNILSMR